MVCQTPEFLLKTGVFFCCCRFPPLTHGVLMPMKTALRNLSFNHFVSVTNTFFFCLLHHTPLTWLVQRYIRHVTRMLLTYETFSVARCNFGLVCNCCFHHQPYTFKANCFVHTRRIKRWIFCLIRNTVQLFHQLITF